MKMRKMELLILFLAVSLVIAGAANADTTTGFVGHLAFEEGTGIIAYDSSPNGYRGNGGYSPLYLKKNVTG